MELRQLEYFCMVSRLNSFTRAAEQLYVSQPAITKAIRNLEQSLNIQLFHRDKKQVILTIEGQAFLLQAEQILSAVKRAVVEIADFKTEERGIINLGVPPMIGSFLFPDIFRQFKRMYPLIDFITAEEGSLATLAKIEKNELDLGIAILPSFSDTIRSLVIMQEEYSLCVHPDHPLAREKSVDFSQLRNEKFILLKPGFYQHQIIINRCLSQNFMPDIIFSSGHIRTIINHIANGTGISFLMNMATKNDPTITVVRLREPIKVNIGVAWKDTANLSPACKAFINFVKDHNKSSPLFTTSGDHSKAKIS